MSKRQKMEDLSFFLSDPVSEEEVAQVVPSVLKNLREALDAVTPESFAAYQARGQQQQQGRQSPIAEDLSEYEVHGDPRSYQRDLLRRAQEENVIVHLGTGMGKTLIAILLIKSFRKTVFLVPSVALVVQQSQTLRANLPHKVGVAYAATIATPEDRRAFLDCSVLVATHGAYLDLLQHYGDMFRIRDNDLLILDECHNCTGRSPYARIMLEFYHSTPVNERPRVLGLTASPLINVKPSVSEGELQRHMEKLQQVMDSRIVSYAQLDDGDPDVRTYLTRQVVERPIHYDISRYTATFPSKDVADVHMTRTRELAQLEYLFNDLGPLCVSYYCRYLCGELSRNQFENESPEEFEAMLDYLRLVEKECTRLSEKDQFHGRTQKLRRLEELLSDQLGRKADAVGLVFVERRITALALNAYFQHRQPSIDAKHDQSSVISQPTQHHQFVDADRDERESGAHDNISCHSDGQFDDADIDADIFASLRHGRHLPATEASGPISIRSEALVRSPHSVFKSLSKGRSYHNGVHDLEHEDWLHQERNIREVLDKMRTGELNLLLATSVVEEGIDIQACSFVVILDSVKNLKGYIQMKGRARHKDACLYVFCPSSEMETTPLTLTSAQHVEERVQRFLSRECRPVTGASASPVAATRSYSGHSLEAEMLAADAGFYRSRFGYLSTTTAKSVLHRFALSQPIDDFARTSKASLRAHLPLFSEDSLILPACCSSPPGLRVVYLSEKHMHLPKKAREGILSLMACVRLHCHGLLNDRLLPLSIDDLRGRVELRVLDDFNKAAGFPGCAVRDPRLARCRAHVYAFSCKGDGIEQLFQRLGHHPRLGLLLWEPLEQDCSFNRMHGLFGSVRIDLAFTKSVDLVDPDVYLLERFYEVVFNFRWRRRTREGEFHVRRLMREDLPFCLLGCIDDNGDLDTSTMRAMVGDWERSQECRKNAVSLLDPGSALSKPRIWVPEYDPLSMYIVSGPSSQRCGADFPYSTRDPRIKTYHDYFLYQRKVEVDVNSFLWHGRRIWSMPKSYQDEPDEADSNFVLPQRSPWDALPKVLIPQGCCMEAGVVDPSHFLATLYLPQLLYAVNECHMVTAFMVHCCRRLPKLHSALEMAPLRDVQQVLSTAGKSQSDNYERLEWLGDGVLKLLQTDTIVGSVEMRECAMNLHAGNLSLVRSIMGANKHLADVCRKFGVDQFILSIPLTRGVWCPPSMELVPPNAKDSNHHLSDKVCADVIEALLGLVFTTNGVDLARECAQELHLVGSCSKNLEYPVHGDLDTDSSAETDVQTPMKTVLGLQGDDRCFPFLEALTHPTYMEANRSSYQRLEWIGDAVLCLVAREWLFQRYPELKVADLVLMESVLVSNESLAFLSVHLGLHKLLCHRDSTLPGRIDAFVSSLGEKRGGLWGTSPPKPLADIVESVIGAVHVVGGLDSSRLVANKILSPLLDLVTRSPVVLQRLKRHPTQFAAMAGGKLLSVRSSSEEQFAIGMKIDKPWTGSCWSTVHRHGTKYVASIRCLERIILSVTHESAAVARNRACAFLMNALDSDDETKTRLRELNATVTGQSN